MPRAIAIDWSGARVGAANRIWTAEAVDGQLVSLEGGRDRAAAIAWLITRRDEVPDAVAGLDFSFGVPAWFADHLACATAAAVWHTVAAQGEHWLESCAPPFWGRPGVRRGPEPQLRACELELAVGGISPKSVFQIGGAGAVGAGSLRGMPFLPALQEAGWTVWPFEPVGSHAVLEIWPRLLTGPVVKSSASARAAWLALHAPQLPSSLAALSASTEDAFDAAASAIVLSRADLAAALARQPVGDVREGAILTL